MSTIYLLITLMGISILVLIILTIVLSGKNSGKSVIIKNKDGVIDKLHIEISLYKDIISKLDADILVRKEFAKNQNVYIEAIRTNSNDKNGLINEQQKFIEEILVVNDCLSEKALDLWAKVKTCRSSHHSEIMNDDDIQVSEYGDLS